MENDVASIYKDGTYAAKNKAMGDDNAAWKAGNVLRIMKDAGLHPKTILEVGCGAGGILVELKKQLPEDVMFSGLEPMPEAYAAASKRSDDRLSFKQATIDTPPDKQFDVVLCLDVFEHIEDYFKFLRGLRSFGGKFIFHIPLDMNTQMVFRASPIRRVRESVGHLHYFSKDTALASLEYCGYKILRHCYTRSWESKYSTFAFKLASLPRRLGYAIAPDFTARVLGGLPLLVLAE